MQEVVQAPKVIRDSDFFGVGVPGIVPPSEGTGTKFLRDDGTWAVPAGGGGGVSDGDKGDITVTDTGATWTINAGAVGTAKLGGDITAAGKALLDDADAAAQRATIGAQASSTLLSAIAGLSPVADRLTYWTGASTAAVTRLSAFARDLVDDTDAAMARSTLGAQAASSLLSAIAGLSPAADRLTYWTGAATVALATLTSFARTLLDDADAATARGTLGAQAASALLSAIAGLSPAANKLTYWTGASSAALTDLTTIARTFLAASDAAAARAVIGAAAPSDIPAIPEGLRYRCIPIHATAGTNVSGSSVPEAPRWMANSYGNTKLADLQGCSEVRLSALVMTAAASGPAPRLLAKYASTFSTNYATWSNLGASGAEVPMSLSATGMADSGWVTMDSSAAIETCNLGVGEGGGSGSTSYAVRSVWMEFR